MPRLLIITTVPATLRAFLLPFARHFAAQGWQVDAMARGVSACAECRAGFHRVWDVDWTRNPFDLVRLGIAARQVRAVVEAQRYDLVHVHTPIAAFVARGALRRLRMSGAPKVIYTAHGFHFHIGRGPIGNFLFSALERCAGRWTDELVVINREDMLAARRHWIVPPGHLHPMKGIGVDTNLYHPGRVSETEVSALRAALGLGPANPLFLVLGEFIRRKRHQVVIEALARLPDHRAHLALAGDGPLLETVRAQAASRGLAGRVHFLGFRRDIPALVRASSALVLVSEQEGLPRSVLEALCLETPVIGSDIRGTRELLEDGCGWLVPVGDVNRLAQAMFEVISHPGDARARGCRGRMKVLDGFDQESILRRHETPMPRPFAAHGAQTRRRTFRGRVLNMARLLKRTRFRQSAGRPGPPVPTPRRAGTLHPGGDGPAGPFSSAPARSPGRYPHSGKIPHNARGDRAGRTAPTRRPASDSARPIPPRVESRRVASALERAQGRTESRRAPAASDGIPPPVHPRAGPPA